MNPPPDKAREWWLLREQFTNRALIRDHSEKWPDDVKGMPSEQWLHVIEFTEFAKLQQKLDFAHEQFEAERKRAEKYRVALEHIAKRDWVADSPQSWKWINNFIDVAREALKD